MTKLENALIWLYVKTWGSFGEIDIKEDLWNFTANDLETAIMGLAYPRKKEKPDRVFARDERTRKSFEKMFTKLFLFSNKNRTRTQNILNTENENKAQRTSKNACSFIPGASFE